MFYKADIAVIFSAVCNLERRETDLLSERKHQNSSDVCFFPSVSGPLDHVSSLSTIVEMGLMFYLFSPINKFEDQHLP